MRLDKFLTENSIGSRSEVKKIIKSGRVYVNKDLVKSPDIKISDFDIVSVDGREISHQKYYYYMFHKPAGYVSACSDEISPTVMDFFKECDRFNELFPVGRLDKDTEGLLIVTNDGAYSHILTSPKKHVFKKYYFETDQKLCDDAGKRVSEGIILKDGMECKPGVLIMESDNRGYLSISEGAYHQVKRMVASLGGHVTYLKRISIGNLVLDSELEKGQFREMTEEEKCQATCQSVKKI